MKTFNQATTLSVPRDTQCYQQFNPTTLSVTATLSVDNNPKRMQIKILRKNKELPLPEYKTPGSVAFDFAAAEDVTILAHEIAYIPTGLIICTPEQHALIIIARSSTPIKKGLMLANGIGIIDQDYCGPEDEIKIQVYNFTDKSVEIKKGDRIAQGMFVKIDKAEWQETDKLNMETRGGFGSTG